MLWEILQEILQEIWWEILQKMLQEILWEMLWEILQEILWEMVWEIFWAYCKFNFEANFQNMQVI